MTDAPCRLAASCNIASTPAAQDRRLRSQGPSGPASGAQTCLRSCSLSCARVFRVSLQPSAGAVGWFQRASQNWRYQPANAPGLR